MSVLTDIVPPIYRKRAYAAYATVGLTIGSMQVAITAVGSDQPKWLLAALAVYGYLGIAFGATAASNTANEPEPPPDDLGI